MQDLSMYKTQLLVDRKISGGCNAKKSTSNKKNSANKRTGNSYTRRQTSKAGYSNSNSTILKKTESKKAIGVSNKTVSKNTKSSKVSSSESFRITEPKEDKKML